MLLKFLLSCILIIAVKCACPNGTLEWKSNCFLFYSKKSGYAAAEIECINLNGHLASVHDGFTNMVLAGARIYNYSIKRKNLEEAQKYFHESTQADFWIGANNVEVPKNWTWTDGTLFDFYNWDNNQPQNTTGSNCAALSLAEGYWSSEDCYKAKTFVCSLPNIQTTIITTTTAATTITTTSTPTPATQRTPCPSAWNFYNGFCYGTYYNQTQMQAEQICIRHGGHLTSIHSKDENEFIGTLSFQSVYILIGLYSELNLGIRWRWTDGTNRNYTNWATGEPCNCWNQCVAMNSNYPYLWYHARCDLMYDKFFCKKRAI